MKLFKVKAKFNKGGSEKQYVLGESEADVTAALEGGYAAAGRKIKSLKVEEKACDDVGSTGVPLMHMQTPLLPVTEALHFASVGKYDVFPVAHFQSEGWFKKVGNEYISVDKLPVVVYRARSDDSLWGRPYDEATDGRFEFRDGPPEVPPIPTRREGRGQS